MHILLRQQRFGKTLISQTCEAKAVNSPSQQQGITLVACMLVQTSLIHYSIKLVLVQI